MEIHWEVFQGGGIPFGTGSPGGSGTHRKAAAREGSAAATPGSALVIWGWLQTFLSPPKPGKGHDKQK